VSATAKTTSEANLLRIRNLANPCGSSALRSTKVKCSKSFCAVVRNERDKGANALPPRKNGFL
jgi:hypothetical protein